MPFSVYDTSHPASTYFTQNGLASCPSNVTVEACFVTILDQLKAQSVSGVRIFVTLCSSNSLAFPGVPPNNYTCGASYQNLAWNPAQNSVQQTWITNVTNFFKDVAGAGITNVSLTFAGSGAPFTLPASQASSPNGACSTAGACCSDTPSTVTFDPLTPYGLEANNYPIGQFWTTRNNKGFNCAPNNPYFIGWTNIFNVINAVLAAAKGHVTVYELELAQEINIMAFSAQMRWIYDNSSPASAPSQYVVSTSQGKVVNVFGALRAMMTANGFDPGRVAYSGAWTDATDAVTNCANEYQDYARNNLLGNITQAINGGFIGVPNGYNTNMGGLVCGGTLGAPQIQSPVYSTQPDIVDLHVYPSVRQTTNTDAMIQQVAALDYGDVPHFLVGAGLTSATIVIGETYGGAINPLNLGTPSNPNYCWLGAFQSPSGAPNDNVAGFNNEGVSSPLSGYTVTFRPWMQLQDPSGQCFTYGSNGPGTPGNYQTVNYNGHGPYTPTHN
jgi:hypothetical protein